MVRVYVSIGSNINREQSIRAGVEELRRHYGQLTLSSVFESKAVGFQGANFYNLVAGFDTRESAQATAHVLHDIERACGRKRSSLRFSSRVLDLDLLLYDDLIINEQGLQVPHQDILNYLFVLQPLAEIAPHGRHPLMGKSYADLWSGFDSSSKCLRPVDLGL